MHPVSIPRTAVERVLEQQVHLSHAPGQHVVIVHADKEERVRLAQAYARQLDRRIGARCHWREVLPAHTLDVLDADRLATHPDQRVVLFVHELDVLLDAMDELQEHRLRKRGQERGGVIIAGVARPVAEAFGNYARPFYEGVNILNAPSGWKPREWLEGWQPANAPRDYAGRYRSEESDMVWTVRCELSPGEGWMLALAMQGAVSLREAEDEHLGEPWYEGLPRVRAVSVVSPEQAPPGELSCADQDLRGIRVQFENRDYDVWKACPMVLPDAQTRDLEHTRVMFSLPRTISSHMALEAFIGACVDPRDYSRTRGVHRSHAPGDGPDDGIARSDARAGPGPAPAAPGGGGEGPGRQVHPAHHARGHGGGGADPHRWGAIAMTEHESQPWRVLCGFHEYTVARQMTTAPDPAQAARKAIEQADEEERWQRGDRASDPFVIEIARIDPDGTEHAVAIPDEYAEMRIVERDRREFDLSVPDRAYVYIDETASGWKIGQVWIPPARPRGVLAHEHEHGSLAERVEQHLGCPCTGGWHAVEDVGCDIEDSAAAGRTMTWRGGRIRRATPDEAIRAEQENTDKGNALAAARTRVKGALEAYTETFAGALESGALRARWEHARFLEMVAKGLAAIEAAGHGTVPGGRT